MGVYFEFYELCKFFRYLSKIQVTIANIPRHMLTYVKDKGTYDSFDMKWGSIYSMIRGL
jgi:hypothetical protein